MGIYKVEKANTTDRETFDFTITKVVKDIEGNEFTVIDRKENWSVEQLESEKVQLEEQLLTVSAKIAKIKELGVK